MIMENDLDYIVETESEEYEMPILRKKPLPKLDAKGITELFFENNRYYVDKIMQTRYKRKGDRLYNYYNFKLIQPFYGEIYIVANSLHGGEWESLELSGKYADYQKETLDFISNYIVNHITHNKDDRIEVNINTFIRERGIGCENGEEYLC